MAEITTKDSAVTGNPTATECDSFLFWSTSLRDTLKNQQQQRQQQDTNFNHISSRINQDHPSGFEIGDHVYVWCDIAAISQVYQHHGIVVDIRKRRPDEEIMSLSVQDETTNANNNENNSNENNNNDDWILKIADFSLMDEEQESAAGSFDQLGQLCVSTSTASKGDGNCGGFKVYESPASKWLKVTTNIGDENGNLDSKLSTDTEKDLTHSLTHLDSSNNSPTPTTATQQLVRARVEFLLQRPELLPPYLLHESNCECVAHWCKTGHYRTGQIEYWLQGTVENGTKVVGGAQLVASLTALSAVPFLIPAIMTYGAVTAGASAVALWRAKHHWKETTDKLNQAFTEHVAAYQRLSFDNMGKSKTI